jgi:hypothetical protein
MPGETIVRYGTGFGATSPAAPANATFPTPLPLATLPTLTIAPATVTYAGLIEPGVYQLNVVVPVTLPAGDAAVVATAGGQRSQANVFPIGAVTDSRRCRRKGRTESLPASPHTSVASRDRASLWHSTTHTLAS